MQEMIVNIACLLVTVAALGIAAWALLSGMLAEQGVDGLFLVSVCLIFAALFSWIPVQWLRRVPWHELLHRRKEETGKAVSTPAARPQERA